jgi:hypothetical protein
MTSRPVVRPVFNTGADSHFGAGAVPAGCPGQPPRRVVDGGITGGSIMKFTGVKGGKLAL